MLKTLHEKPFMQFFFFFLDGLPFSDFFRFVERYMTKQWLIRYYLNEGTYKTGSPAFTETVIGNRNYVVNWAQNKLKTSQFKFYDLIEK